MTFDWAAVIAALPDLLQGLQLTLLIALAGLAGGIVLGILAGVALTYGGRLTVLPAQLYVALIRGTPIVVQVMFVYFALPIMMDIRISGISAAIITLVVNSGAYNAEIIRGALDGVPFGLREAGLAMGLPFVLCCFTSSHPSPFGARCRQWETSSSTWSRTPRFFSSSASAN
jgi:glutamine transport system permease protein